jgi:hypothetical protein
MIVKRIQLILFQKRSKRHGIVKRRHHHYHKKKAMSRSSIVNNRNVDDNLK